MCTRTKRLENIPEIEGLAQVCQDAGITNIAERVQFIVTKLLVALEELGITGPRREYTHPRDELASHPKGVLETLLFWTCAGRVGYKILWPIQSRGQNKFIGQRLTTVLGRHQQES